MCACVCAWTLRGPAKPSRWRAAPQQTWWELLPPTIHTSSVSINLVLRSVGIKTWRNQNKQIKKKTKTENTIRWQHQFKLPHFTATLQKETCDIRKIKNKYKFMLYVINHIVFFFKSAMLRLCVPFKTNKHKIWGLINANDQYLVIASLDDPSK